MALLLKQLFGGGNAPIPSGAPADPDFADFATAPSPAAPSHAASNAFVAVTHTPVPASGGGGLFGSAIFGSPFGMQGRPYTKWYRVWERVTYKDFFQEMIVIPILLVIFLVNVIGTRMNKARAKKWADTFIPLLQSEYAQVGFTQKEAATATSSEDLLKQGKMYEFTTYATGRQNVAFTDVKLTLLKRYNPMLMFFEYVLSFLVDTVPTPVEGITATTYCFDGKEKSMLPNAASVGPNSSFDGFVWAVVHKDHMQQLRDDRYDLSLTATRDNAKLPNWATVMSESSEITDSLLTPELIKAIEQCGEDLEALIITDQPIDAPKKLNELVPRKRISLMTKLSSTATSNALFTYFLRMPDLLVSTAHYRPEAMRKIRATREEEMRKIRKVDEEEKAEERKTASDKLKKEERERKLKGMNAEEQRKFLEREKADERKKGAKKQQVRG